ncbi:MAG TPA: alpha/beta fold hydrolase [Bacteroidota bacterium]|nr:alpha/beta fold hydrolase [Bacteroidota bacterium]
MTPSLIDSTLVHKIRQPGWEGDGKHPALILLHGRGTNEDDLLGLVDYLDPRFFVVSARAPFRFNEGFGGFTWYDVRDIGTPDAAQFGESYDRLVRFVVDVRQHYPVDVNRIFLLGFSMGSVMSFALSLTRPELVRGVVAHSGYIPEQTTLQFAWDRLEGLSLFVAHGVDDPVVPILYGRHAQDLLAGTKADLTYREYPIPHTISEKSLTDLSEWLQKMLAVPQDMK